jgi:hypothetical protein
VASQDSICRIQNVATLLRDFNDAVKKWVDLIWLDGCAQIDWPKGKSALDGNAKDLIDRLVQVRPSQHSNPCDLSADSVLFDAAAAAVAAAACCRRRHCSTTVALLLLLLLLMLLLLLLVLLLLLLVLLLLLRCCLLLLTLKLPNGDDV